MICSCTAVRAAGIEKRPKRNIFAPKVLKKNIQYMEQGEEKPLQLNQGMFLSRAHCFQSQIRLL